MLACAPSAWDMFYVYESDFVRELKEILTNGLQAAALEVQPFGGLSGVGETWADFNWQPDGKYVNFVRCAVVVYITHTVIHESLRLPPWLEEDLVGLGAGALHCRPEGFYSRFEAEQDFLGSIAS